MRGMKCKSSSPVVSRPAMISPMVGPMLMRSLMMVINSPTAVDAKIVSLILHDVGEFACSEPGQAGCETPLSVFVHAPASAGS